MKNISDGNVNEINEAPANKNTGNNLHNDLPEDIYNIPQIAETFDVIKKVGSGSFSSVCLARMKEVPEKRYAIKYIIPTTHPTRTAMELSCLIEFGGKDNILPVSTCVRHLDNIAMVMPYFPHNEFKSYVGNTTLSELRLYVSSLLVALRRVHEGGVIHRDVKPRNFLYDMENKRFALIDFGLAQKVSDVALFRPVMKKDKKKPREIFSLTPSPTRAKDPKRVCNDENHTPNTKRMSASRDAQEADCDCFDRPRVCRKCLKKPSQSACRAGTPGFRPPEVLMKYVQQTTAVDIWAVGIIFISLVSGKYPFFDCTDDLTSLKYITKLLGSEVIRNSAAAIGKSFLCAPEYPSNDLRTLCRKLRKRNISSKSSNDKSNGDNDNNDNTEIINNSDDDHTRPYEDDDDDEGDGKSKITNSESTNNRHQATSISNNDCLNSLNSSHVTFIDLLPDSTFDLMAKLLDPNPLTRITAVEALKHPFFNDM